MGRGHSPRRRAGLAVLVPTGCLVTADRDRCAKPLAYAECLLGRVRLDRDSLNAKESDSDAP
jgi:hypothetical protein